MDCKFHNNYITLSEEYASLHPILVVLLIQKMSAVGISHTAIIDYLNQLFNLTPLVFTWGP